MFIYFAAASDHVDIDLMFKTVYHRLMPTSNRKLIQLMKSIYSHTKPLLAQTLDDKFGLLMVVQQGGPESPTLFMLFMDFAMWVF